MYSHYWTLYLHSIDFEDRIFKRVLNKVHMAKCAHSWRNIRMTQIVANSSIKITWYFFCISHRAAGWLTFDPLSSVECDLTLALWTVGADSDEGSAGHCTVQPSLGPSRHGRRTRLSLTGLPGLRCAEMINNQLWGAYCLLCQIINGLLIIIIYFNWTLITMRLRWMGENFFYYSKERCEVYIN